ncbi:MULTISPECIES: TetR/AcrR family transcriptional regulator [unclassified Pseudonocardia]|uniref:TetR/AcrR family transcriptional regulator n=1 Tax=unclassified Pseudonocardia TaxID=2619320 RepID=UPI00076115A4|nr:MULTISPECIES: TetR/AcrR family transcriptional regulator [unclassified Pseudonocardia]
MYASLGKHHIDRTTREGTVTSTHPATSRTRDDLVEARKSAILAAAEKLVAVHGFDALRLRDVSAAAGVSIGLIQHYFTTRDELLRETMRTASVRRAAQWAQLAHGHNEAPETLRALLEGSISDRHRCVVWLETCAAATRHQDLVADVQRNQEAWQSAIREVVDQGVARGDFSPDIPVADIVALLVSLIDGLILGAATEPEDAKRSAYRRQLLREVAERLLPPGSAVGAP